MTEEQLEAIARVRAAVEKRDVQAMADLRRAHFGRQPTEQQVAQMREWVTVSSLRLGDLQALLTLSEQPQVSAQPQVDEERALSIMLPPGDADGEYLDGWVDGQQYLIDNAAIRSLASHEGVEP